MPLQSLASSPDALGWVLRLAGVGAALSSAEMLAVPGFFGRRGLLVGDISLTRSRWLVRPRVHPMLRRLLSFRATLAIIAARLAGAVVTVVQPGGLHAARWGVFVVAAATLLLRVRTQLAIHGVGAMSVVVFVSAALALVLDTHRAFDIALWFIAAQGLLAYFIAGASKFAAPRWRAGRAVSMILGMLAWGTRRSAVLTRRQPSLGRLASWGTMSLEATMPLALVTPIELTLALLAAALLLHVVAAFEMGLNTFPWLFASTYPAVIFCWYAVH